MAKSDNGPSAEEVAWIQAQYAEVERDLGRALTEKDKESITLNYARRTRNVRSPLTNEIVRHKMGKGKGK